MTEKKHTVKVSVAYCCTSLELYRLSGFNIKFIFVGKPLQLLVFP